jgi:L-seryl-tRNA(Ser) seleniumtransferase
MKMDDKTKGLLKELPKIDEVMLLLEKRGAFPGVSRDIVKDACRAVVDGIRRNIMSAGGGAKLPDLEETADRVVRHIGGFFQHRLRRVVNATGIILHTNLGRAPLCREAITRIVEVAEGYSNLEFDLEKGERGLRYDHVRELLCLLSGAEDAMVVNNNAAAVLLALNTLAAGKDALVSRGELVEVGGEFRIPEVMEKSGACLREVGSTNRTRIADYEGALGAATGIILKVHTSNFRITGFTEETGLEALVALGKKHGVPVMDDLGSGCFIELDRYGLEREPTVRDVLATGVDVVTFSGDKLLGGPQAGIILGKSAILQKIKRNPLNRALRIDKLTLAALEATMIEYLEPEKAVCNLRVLKALTEPPASVKKRARKLLAAGKKAAGDGAALSLKQGASLAGGGSLPTCEIPTTLVCILPKSISPSKLEKRLRALDVPVIARIADDEVLLDARTIAPEEIPLIRDGLKTIFAP